MTKYKTKSPFIAEKVSKSCELQTRPKYRRNFQEGSSILQANAVVSSQVRKFWLYTSGCSQVTQWPESFMMTVWMFGRKLNAWKNSIAALKSGS